MVSATAIIFALIWITFSLPSSLFGVYYCVHLLSYRWVCVCELVRVCLRVLFVIWQQQQQQHRAVICHREHGKPQKNHKCIESRSKTNQKYAQKYQLELAIYVIKIPMVYFSGVNVLFVPICLRERDSVPCCCSLIFMCTIIDFDETPHNECE